MRDLDSDSDPDEFLQSASDDGGDACHWLEAGSENFAFHSLVSSKLACRWLPPGTPSTLFQEYLAVQRLRGGRAASCFMLH